MSHKNVFTKIYNRCNIRVNIYYKRFQKNNPPNNIQYKREKNKSFYSLTESQAQINNKSKNLKIWS